MGLRRIDYSRSNLVAEIASICKADPATVDAKLHSTFFEEFFNHEGVRTLLVEHPYVDRDYLEDFAFYYSKCFTPPAHSCGRIHVFRSQFDDVQLASALERADASWAALAACDEDYLGFIVVKPLPNTPIGRTCLRTYPTSGTGRHFPVLRDYKAHILGHTVSFDTLAFQEQDREVAACATSALWSAFHGTGTKYNHAIPTPVEITRHATERHSSSTNDSLPARSFPASDGLSLEQMADAVRKLGLEPYSVAVSERQHLQGELYAYLKCGLPAVLAIQLLDVTNVIDPSLDTPEYKGGHAVTVAGFHLVDGPAMPLGTTGVKFKAARLDKVYCHDDQVGPFSRMVLGPRKFLHPHDNRPIRTPFATLDSSWDLHNIAALPYAMLVPTYPKMRLKFATALEAVLEFMAALQCVRPGVDLEWDVYLTTNRGLTRDIASTEALSGVYRSVLLTTPLPRFMWRAIAADMNGVELFELILDATDLEQGKHFIRGIEYDNAVLAPFRGAVGISTAGFKNAALGAVEYFQTTPLVP